MPLQPPPCQEIQPRALHSALDADATMILIDILPSVRYQKIHIPQAQNACLYEVSFLQQVAGVVPDKGAKIILYGAGLSTQDARTAAEKLLRAGYRDVTILDGGVKGWCAAGLPVIGSRESLADDPATFVKLPQGQYQVDVAQSGIEWAGRNPNSKHFGTARLVAGEVQVFDGEVSGEFTIDMDSIENVNLAGDALQPVLISHLKSDDFFFVNLFPTAVFTLQKALKIENACVTVPNFEIEGTLELRGAKAGIRFPATVTMAETGELMAEAHFDIDRTRWGVIYGSARFFEYLGMHLVFDLISFQIKIVARK